MKHTPGPWRWKKKIGHEDDEYSMLVSDGPAIIILSGLYQIPECGQVLTMEITGADARLIALAPELLEFVTDSICNCDDEYGNRKLQQCDRCLLLAKAKGEE